MAGDTYNNTGNNFGHMGPVYKVRRMLEFDAQVAEALRKQLPKDKPIAIDIVGNTEALQVGNEIAKFLEKEGFTIREQHTYGAMTPSPPGPLHFDPDTYILTIQASL